MTNDDIVIIGLPSAGLQMLTDAFYIRRVENAAIRDACENSNGPRDLTPEWMTGKLEGYFDDDSGRRTLMIYQTPWGFLERQIRSAASAPASHEQLEFFAKKTLGFWHAYHASLLALHRKHKDGCLLINGDRLIEAEPVVALVEERLGLRLDVQQNPSVKEGCDAPSHREAAWRQIVEAFAPDCVDLYSELECCAELMGRQPEFDEGGFDSRDAEKANMLWLMASRGRIEDVLSHYGIDTGDVESRLEAVLRAHREQKELAPARLQEIAVLKEKLATQQAEAERRLLQVRQLEEKVKSRQVEADGYLSRMRQLEQTLKSLQMTGDDRLLQVRKLEEELKSQQAAGEGHLLRVHQVEEKLAVGNSQIDSLKKENELYLLQLHQIQEELEHYFELNRQKDEQLAALQQRLDHHVELERKNDEQLAELQQRLDLESAPVVRKIARRMSDLKKSAASLLPSLAAQAGGEREQDENKERALNAETEKLRASGLFDEKWYLQTYPDVAQAGHDPIEHYLQFGVADGRNPSPYFDTRWYLESYSDVAAAGMNPLLHYIQFGKAEGRQPMRFVA